DGDDSVRPVQELLLGAAEEGVLRSGSDFLAVNIVDDPAAQQFGIRTDPATGVELTDAQDPYPLLADDAEHPPQYPGLERQVDPQVAPQRMQARGRFVLPRAEE